MRKRERFPVFRPSLTLILLTAGKPSVAVNCFAGAPPRRIRKCFQSSCAFKTAQYCATRCLLHRNYPITAIAAATNRVFLKSASFLHALLFIRLAPLQEALTTGYTPAHTEALSVKLRFQNRATPPRTPRSHVHCAITGTTPNLMPFYPCSVFFSKKPTTSSAQLYWFMNSPAKLFTACVSPARKS